MYYSYKSFLLVKTNVFKFLQTLIKYFLFKKHINENY